MNLPRWISAGAPDKSAWRCGNCAHFTDDPAVLEDVFKGINSLSSVRGCSRGDAGICRLHGQYLLPVHSCSDFVKKS